VEMYEYLDKRHLILLDDNNDVITRGELNRLDEAKEKERERLLEKEDLERLEEERKQRKEETEEKVFELLDMFSKRVKNRRLGSDESVFKKISEEGKISLDEVRRIVNVLIEEEDVPESFSKILKRIEYINGRIAEAEAKEKLRNTITPELLTATFKTGVPKTEAIALEIAKGVESFVAAQDRKGGGGKKTERAITRKMRKNGDLFGISTGYGVGVKTTIIRIKKKSTRIHVSKYVANHLSAKLPEQRGKAAEYSWKKVDVGIINVIRHKDVQDFISDNIATRLVV